MYLAALKHLNVLGRSDASLIPPSYILLDLHTLHCLGHLVEVGAEVNHLLS